MRILLAEDSADMNRLITKMLTKEGYTVDSCTDGIEALEYFETGEYDGAVLDIMMPGMDGMTLLRRIRESGSKLPVLMLTAKDAISDRVAGLDAGADDYLIKPFDFHELFARLRVMLRKRSGSSTNSIAVGDLILETDTRRVLRAGREISLIPKEYTLLCYMMMNRDIVLSREQLENRIWNYDQGGSSNNIDVYISRLRKKIDEGFDSRLLHTVRGVGYVLRQEEQDR